MNITPVNNKIDVGFKMAGLPEPKNAAEAKKLWEASKSMEALFSKYLLDQVEKGLPGTNSKGIANGNMYADLFAQSLADQMAERGALGIAKQIYLSADDISRKLVKSSEGEKS
jgi:Rod binding domain-containing protein